MSKSPGEYIQEALHRRGLGQDDLAQILGRPAPRVNELIKGKLALSPELAMALATVLGETPEEWLRRESLYRLSLETTDVTVIKRRARVHEIAPVKEMARRGWIGPSDDHETIERDVLRFYRMSDLDATPDIHGAMRKTAPSVPATQSQMAWAFRIRQVAEAIPAASIGKYDDAKIPTLAAKLRKLAAYSSEVRKVSDVLHSAGIRFVIVEGLSGAKLDGFATWIGDHSPVIGMSLRFNRLDSFWFTLCHEFTHIKHRDLAPVDGEVGNLDELPLEVKPMIERRADKEAAEMLVPPDELQSFINRVGPLYSAERINQFANRIKMHPNIIIGQLKHRGEIKHSAHNRSVVQIRDGVIESAIVDGWGKSIRAGALS